MTELVACLSTGKGTWAHVSKLIGDEAFSKIFLLTNDFGIENFKPMDKVELIKIDANSDVKKLKEDIKAKLKDRIKESEVQVNFISGSGNEHMALVSALLSMGVGIRLTAVTEKGIEEV